MAIINTGDFPIDPTTTTGTDLADRLNRFEQAVASSHLNPTRPAYLKAGAVWSESVPAGGYKLYFFDGTKDHEIGSVSASGTAQFGGGAPLAPVFSATATYTTGQIIYDPATGGYLQAKNDVAAGPYNPGDWQQLSDVLAAVKPSATPSGAIMQFAGTVVPADWLLCNGASVLRSAYKDLFAAIGTAYGSADANHFNLPNLADKFPIGTGGSKPLANTGGAKIVTPTGTVQNTTLTNAEMPSHQHVPIFTDGNGFSLNSGPGAQRRLTFASDGLAAEIYTSFVGGGGAHTHGLTMNALNIEPPYIALNYIIKI